MFKFCLFTYLKKLSKFATYVFFNCAASKSFVSNADNKYVCWSNSTVAQGKQLGDCWCHSSCSVSGNTHDLGRSWQCGRTWRTRGNGGDPFAKWLKSFGDIGVSSSVVMRTLLQPSSGLFMHIGWCPFLIWYRWSKHIGNYSAIIWLAMNLHGGRVFRRAWMIRG